MMRIMDERRRRAIRSMVPGFLLRLGAAARSWFCLSNHRQKPCPRKAGHDASRLRADVPPRDKGPGWASLLPSWPAPEPAIQRYPRQRLDGRVKPGHEGNWRDRSVIEKG